MPMRIWFFLALKRDDVIDFITNPIILKENIREGQKITKIFDRFCSAVPKDPQAVPCIDFSASSGCGRPTALAENFTFVEVDL